MLKRSLRFSCRSENFFLKGAVQNHKQGEPVNQMAYGLIAGEWHKNHHDHPRLARSGLSWWQVDLPYWIILLMKSCGLVTKCNSKVRSPVSRHPTT